MPRYVRHWHRAEYLPFVFPDTTDPGCQPWVDTSIIVEAALALDSDSNEEAFYSAAGAYGKLKKKKKKKEKRYKNLDSRVVFIMHGPN
jgi:hypothetical protein